ncbi:helix-turn-helix domain-containing protein [Cohnella zeiphila]|uniref:Helix-turn-helix domain-containing protein n=1 Tax=Cohnella zeiphila TaxID=2761120 RepID=A0A7X0SRD1_9BACL|nr:helix-turn-helix domain-containing protein [Cohnella zeiphila]MBB6734743.1 helix-turn-helix domain-containing protein [Cohnella zeiphila]
MKKSWLFKTLLFNLFIFLFVAAFLLFLLFHLLTKQNEDEMTHVSRQYAIQVMQTVDSHLQSIDQNMLKGLLTSTGLNNFIKNGAQDQYYLNYTIVQDLLKLKDSNSLIHSIYLVHPKQNYVLSTSTIQSLPQYGDYSFVKTTVEQVASIYWSDARCFSEFENQACTHVVSLVRRYPSASNEGIYLVVNISVSSINQLIKSFYDFKLHEIQISDRSGQLFLDSKNDMTREALDKVVSSSVTSPYTGWSVASGSENQNIVFAIHLLTNIWMFVGIIFVAVGSVVIIIRTRKQYIPIQKIFLRLNSLPIFKSTHLLTGKNELSVIESAFNLMIEQSSQFQLLMEEDKHLRKRQLFYELIEGSTRISIEEWQEYEDNLSVPRLLPYQWIAIIEIDRFQLFGETYSPRDQNLLRFILIQVLQEIVGSHEGAVWSDWVSPQRLCSLMQFKVRQFDQVHEVVHRLHDWVNDNLKFSVTIGVGEQADSIGTISESYKEAMIAIQYKATIGASNIIFYRDVQKLDNRKSFYDIYVRFQLLAQSMRIQEEQWKEKFADVFRIMKECRLSRDDVARLLLFFISQFEHQESINSQDQPRGYQVRLEQMKAQIDQFEEIEQLQNEFYSELTELLEAIKTDRVQRKQHHLIHEIREYIEAHFTDSNLSLELFNDKFGIGVKNLSKLFKEEFGVNFIDYLTHLRIERAKSLLLETDRPVQEIAEEVAYSGAIAFGRVFKRIVGVTPSVYREQIKTNGETRVVENDS